MHEHIFYNFYLFYFIYLESFLLKKILNELSQIKENKLNLFIYIEFKCYTYGNSYQNQGFSVCEYKNQCSYYLFLSLSLIKYGGERGSVHEK